MCIYMSLCWSALHLDCNAQVSGPERNMQQPDRHMVQQWTTKDGLPVNFFWGVLQVSNGYVWVSSNYGLTRFDGSEFVTYSKENTGGWGANNRVVTMCESGDGTLWFQTVAQGNDSREVYRFVSVDSVAMYAPNVYRLTCLERGALLLQHEDHRIEFINRLGKSYVYASPHALDTDETVIGAVENDSTFWMSFKNQFGRFQNSVFERFDRAPGIISDTTVNSLNTARQRDIVHSYSRARDGTLVMASFRQLMTYRAGELVPIYTSEKHELSQILTQDHGNDLWVIEGDEVLRFNGTTIQRYAIRATEENALASGTEVLVSQWGEVYLDEYLGSARHNLYRLEKEGFVPLGLDTYGVHVVLDIEHDVEGNVWLATDVGLFAITPRKMGVLTKEQGLNSFQVFTIAQDTKGLIWVGGWGEPTQIIDGKSWHVRDLLGELPHNSVRAIWPEEDGSVWIGTMNGLARVLNDSLYTVKSFGTWMSVLDVLRDSKGRLWVAAKVNLFTYNGTSFEAMLDHERIEVRSILEDNSGVYWAGTSRGLYMSVDGETWTHPKHTVLATRAINAIYNDSKGHLWFSTNEDGVIRWHEGTAFQYTLDHGLVTNGIHNVIEDDNGDYWMATDIGLMQITHESMDAVYQGRSAALEVVHLTEDDGLPTAEFVSTNSSVFKDESGRIWYGSLAGVVIVDPERIEAYINKMPPVTFIQSFEVNGITHAPGEPQTFKPGPVNSVSFQFTTPSFRSVRNRHYRYRLEGYEEEWTTAMEDEIQYTNLFPGKYTFNVFGRNSDGYWSEKPAVQLFIIAPVYYQTWWFWSLVALIVVSLGYTFFRQYRTTRDLKVAQLRNRMADDLHDGLGGPIAAMSLAFEAISNKNYLNDADRAFLKRQIQTARNLSEEFRVYIWAVDSSSDELSLLIPKLIHYARAHIPQHQLKCTYPEVSERVKVNMFLRRHIYLLFREAVSNIMRHAGAANVSIQIDYLEETLYVSICDQGKGFDMQNYVPGRGIKSMHRRAKEMEGEISVSSTLGNGTTVSFWTRIR